jgi:hypothetical protein
MLTAAIRSVLLRELDTLAREIDAYPDEAGPWTTAPGLPNVAGTLALHVAGNLRHCVGAQLGGTTYARDRDAEFARRDVPRATLRSELAAARRDVDTSLSALPAAALAADFPQPVAGMRIQTGEFLVHLAAHTAYHLGQVDYHRRAVTANALGVGAVSPAALGTARPAPKPPAT